MDLFWYLVVQEVTLYEIIQVGSNCLTQYRVRIGNEVILVESSLTLHLHMCLTYTQPVVMEFRERAQADLSSVAHPGTIYHLSKREQECL